MRRTVVDLAAAFGRHVASAMAGLALVPLVARTLGAEALGAWAVLGTTALLLGLSDGGLASAAQRATLRGEHAAARELVGLALTATLVSAPLLVLAGLALLRGPDADGALHAHVSAAWMPTALAGFVLAWGAPARAVLLARGEVRALAGLRAGAAVLQIAGAAAGLAVAPGLASVAIASLAAALVETLGAAMLVRRLDPLLPLGPRRPKSWALAGRAWRDGSAALAVGVGGVLALRLDVALLAASAPLAAVAAYGVASRAVDQSFTIAKQASTALLHRLGDDRERAAAVRLGTALLGGSVASGMAALALPGRGLLRAWAGEVTERPELGLGLVLLGVTAVLSATHETIASALSVAGGSAWEAALPLVVGYGLDVVLSVGGARTHGVLAVAGGTLAGTALSSAWLWRRARLRFVWLRPGALLAPAAASAVVGLAVAWTLRAQAADALASGLACTVVVLAGSFAAALTARTLGRHA